MRKKVGEPITFDDLLGNLSELEKIIAKAYTIPSSADFYINLISSKELNEIAKLNIIMNVIVANIVIFRDTTSSNQFIIEWTSHPINKIVNTWLKHIDTQKERTRYRLNQIKEELIETACVPKRFITDADIEGL